MPIIPKELWPDYIIDRDQKIRSALDQVQSSVIGSLSWSKANPENEFLWDNDVQSIIKEKGFKIEIIKKSFLGIQIGKTGVNSDVITLKSPYGVKRDQIKNKMKKEFSE